MTAELAGAVALGGAAFSFGDDDRDHAIDVIRTAYDAGVRVFDTARAYAPVGDPTHNERLLRDALTGRSDVLIGTKGGHWRESDERFPVDNRPERLRADVETSLGVLGLECLPLFYVHRVDLGTVPVEESVGALADLKREGKIARIGLSNVTPAQLSAATEVAEIAAVQNRLSVRADVARMRADAGAMVPVCERLGVALFGFSPFIILPTDPDQRPFEEVFPRLARIAAERVIPLPRLVARAVLASSPAISLVVGATRVETAREAGRMMEQDWDDALSVAYQNDRRDLVPGWLLPATPGVTGPT